MPAIAAIFFAVGAGGSGKVDVVCVRRVNGHGKVIGSLAAGKSVRGR